MDFGLYKNRLPYEQKSKDPAMYAAYQAEEARLTALFKRDALREVGLEGHPKADAIFSCAWEQGHASGHSDVFCHLSDLAELFVDDMKPKPNVTAGQGRALVGYRIEVPLQVETPSGPKTVAGTLVFFFADGGSMWVTSHSTAVCPYLMILERA